MNTNAILVSPPCGSGRWVRLDRPRRRCHVQRRLQPCEVPPTFALPTVTAGRWTAQIGTARVGGPLAASTIVADLAHTIQGARS